MLIKSALITQGSGSLGGVTLSRNRGGMYLRARAIPTDPNSTQQALIRGYLATLVNRWTNVLTAANRDAWNLYADNVTVIGPLGDPINLSGQQHFIRSNVPRMQAGATVVDAGPTTYDLGSFGAVSIVSATAPAVVSVAFDDTDAWVDEDDSWLLSYASRGLNPTINFFRGPYQLMGTLEGDSVTPPTTPVVQASPFTITAGQFQYYRFRVTRADGRLSNQLFVGPETVV